MPFAGAYALGFSFHFKANAMGPTKVIATFYKNGTELGRGRALSGAPVDDVTSYNLTVVTPLAANDVIDVCVNFATNDGYFESNQSHFWGHYVPRGPNPSSTDRSLLANVGFSRWRRRGGQFAPRSGTSGRRRHLSHGLRNARHDVKM